MAGTLSYGAFAQRASLTALNAWWKAIDEKQAEIKDAKTAAAMCLHALENAHHAVVKVPLSFPPCDHTAYLCMTDARGGARDGD